MATTRVPPGRQGMRMVRTLRASQVRDAADDDVCRCFIGLVRHWSVPGVMAPASVVVSPSLRNGGWREHIGLQIVEALAARRTALTSSESGVAEWFRQRHNVAATATATATAPGVSELASAPVAVQTPLSCERVLASLPGADSRRAAARRITEPEMTGQ